MTPVAALADPSPAPAPAPGGAAHETPSPARARIERQMAMLARLAEIGMEIAEACGRDARAAAAAAEDGAAPSPEHRRDHAHNTGLVFARVARAVRMTIALEQRLADDLADLDRADARAEQARKDDRRIRLSRLVGEAARTHVEAGAEARGAHLNPAEAWARPHDDTDAVESEIERLSYEAYERLIDAEDGFTGGLTFDQAVAAVCKDLGLSPDGCARLRGAVAPPGGGRDLRRDSQGAPEDHPGDDPGGGAFPSPLIGLARSSRRDRIPRPSPGSG